MPTRSFPKGQLQEVCEGEDTNLLHFVEQGKWISEGKYSFRETIVRTRDTGKFYSISEYRSGSYFTDWYYSWEDEGDQMELTEVHEVREEISVWQTVDFPVPTSGEEGSECVE